MKRGYENELLQRMTAADRRALDLLAPLRESALAHARGGRLDDAAAPMRLARFLLSLTPLSDDGRDYARSLHDAAESYLSFRGGDHAVAHARMASSIAATERLAARWGACECLVYRRFHLEHNLMRVEAASGATHPAARRGGLLLDALGAAAADGRLDPAAAEPLLDLVAETLADLGDHLVVRRRA